MSEPILGAIEAGGTKFVCAVGTGPDDLDQTRFPTGPPDETLRRVLEFFRAKQSEHGPLAALGVGTFGPADVDPASPTFGHILNTPKSGWQGTDLGAALREVIGDRPLAIDTDTNAAAWGERRWGAARGLDDFVYLTIGTGIGGGIVTGGRLLHGIGHPELGHLRIPHNESHAPFEGTCPFHGDCLEGLASGTALEARWSGDPKTFAPDHPAWELQASYLADALLDLHLTLAPQRFILGGGVMGQTQLFPMLRQRFLQRMAGYLATPGATSFIGPAALGPDAGVLGALALASDTLSATHAKP